MGLHLQTVLARRRIRHKNGGIGWAVWAVCAAAVLLPAALMLFVRPRLAEYAANYVQYYTTTAMEQAVQSCTAQTLPVGVLQTDSTGQVTTLTTDAAALNQLRTDIVRRVYDEIGALETARTSVAVGTLLDPQYLAGVGPRLSFGVTSLGCVTAETQSDFSDAGINQTLYTLSIRVNADYSIQLLGCSQPLTISAEYPLEETVIVGKVPLVASSAD